MTSSLAPASSSRWSRMRGALTRQDKRSLAGMFAFIVLLHVIGFGVLLTMVVPQHFTLGATGIFGIGVGILAYTLGMRHAFDADHIAAIDNTTRKLVNDGKRPLSVGFFFSLGHSTIVFVMALLLNFGFRSLNRRSRTTAPSCTR